MRNPYGKNWVPSTRKLMDPPNTQSLKIYILDIYSVWLSDAANFRGSWVTARVYPRVFTLFSCTNHIHPFTRHFVFLSTQQYKFLEEKNANNGENNESIHRIWLLSIHNLRGAYKVFVGKHEGTEHLKGPGVNGRLILQWSYETGWESEDWIHPARKKGQVAFSCVHS
jgi:hypothetical protein